jgi:prepilin peptidase CpaA
MLTFTPEFVYPAASLVCASVGAVYDLRSRRVPNFVTLPAFAFGLLLHFTLGGWRQLTSAAAAGVICGLIFLVFYLAGGMGAGDVKLIAAAGCIAGMPLIVSLLIWTSLAGGAMALGVALYRRRLKQTILNTLGVVVHHKTMGLTPHPECNLDNARALRLPYAVAIAAGSSLSLCLLLFQR